MKLEMKARTRADETHLLRCQEAIGYLFRREGLLRKAITHSSVKDEKNPSNERLEFLGDAILGMVISEYLFSILPGNDEGDLTKIKSVVVSTQSLARLGLELGLDRFLLTGRGIRMKDEMPRSLIANMVEAIIAAVYLDRGMEAARHFILDHLHGYVEEVMNGEYTEKNYKSLLQQQAQKTFSSTPTYRVLAEAGPDHSKLFRVVAVIRGREFPCGYGHSKKEAEQEAAKAALELLAEEARTPGRAGEGGTVRRSKKKIRRPAAKKSSRSAAPAAETGAKAPARRAPARKEPSSPAGSFRSS